MSQHEHIAILDFGSQYTQLIARRLREQHVCAEIFPANTPAEQLRNGGLRGVILSGGPGSVHESTVTIDPSILELDVPILGICYGMQLLNHYAGGRSESLEIGEYGQQWVSLKGPSCLFEGLQGQQRVWMSHGDSIAKLADGFNLVAVSEEGLVAAVEHHEKPHYGVQFHPEVTHTDGGYVMLENFARRCGCVHSWTMDSYLEDCLERIREQVGDRQVVSLVSGGVDSTVATFLCLRALGSDRVHSVHIDNGLMREGESEEVVQLLKQHGLANLHRVDASERFLEALKGVTAPEEKRKIIGDLFMQIVDDELSGFEGYEDAFLCQGTLYTDLIESGQGCGANADVIKSHHNVNSPFVLKKRQEGKIVEPNSGIFKDEVRELAHVLGIPNELAWRHPFPGPGLAVRIAGEVTESRLKRLRRADQILIEELYEWGFYDSVWQAFAVLLPVCAVGVQGDHRTEGEAIALRTVTSHDGMTAEFGVLPWDLLAEVSRRITNEVAGIARVVYDITSKPPATIEWE